MTYFDVPSLRISRVSILLSNDAVRFARTNKSSPNDLISAVKLVSVLDEVDDLTMARGSINPLTYPD